MKCILKGIKVDESRLQEYWAKAKVLLIATSAFELPANYDSALQGNIEGYALHDREGNYPLHNAICEAPCQSNLPPLVKEILSAFPEAAMRKNLEGEAPLFDAMRKGMIWEKGRKDINQMEEVLKELQDTADDRFIAGSRSVAKGDTRHSRTLKDLIGDMNWEKLRNTVRECKEELKEVDNRRGWTVLHYMCALPPVPRDLFRTVVELHPEATRVRDKKWGQTPLHVLCWNSQKSVSKVQILLEYMAKEDLMIRTHLGGSALHCACSGHAFLPVHQELIRANPEIVLVESHEYKHTALVALWQSHLNTIQGHMQVARILKGETVEEGHFKRFWEKVVLMATTAFKLSPTYSREMKNDVERYTLHGLQFLRAPLKIQQIAIKLHPEWVSAVDSEGNYPLHNVVIRRPFRTKDVSLIKDLLAAYPGAASKQNIRGDAPIFIALRERIAWDAGVEALVEAQPEILSSMDRKTNLYPFLLAAFLDGKVAVETTYQLLCANPHVAKV
ncbi:MAG: hypothetical protein SGBAC_001703 [Bacillariaceae sp.]